MKHLYVIGNGFDIFTGLHTRYSDFRNWLKHNYVFVYDALVSAYGVQDSEWWNDFEVSLGKLNIKRYVLENTPPPKSFEEIIKEIESRKTTNLNLPPSLDQDSPCADRLAGLFDIIHYCLRKWIESMTSIVAPKTIHLETENSFFINFNYTRTLEFLYGISKEQILHIHGCAYDSEKLVFGHNSHIIEDGNEYDSERVIEVLGGYHKNPYEYIYKHVTFLNRIKDVEYVYIYGLSLSPVDIDYIDWIYNHTPTDAKWEISWYSEEDEKRIAEFVLEHSRLDGKVQKMRLTPIE